MRWVTVTNCYPAHFSYKWNRNVLNLFLNVASVMSGVRSSVGRLFFLMCYAWHVFCQLTCHLSATWLVVEMKNHSQIICWNCGLTVGQSFTIVTLAPSLPSFKRRLKTELFARSYPDSSGRV